MAAELGLPSPMGTRVLSVTKGSPAEAAGLQAGDVILQIDGVRVEDDAHLINLVSLIEVGKRVPLVIFRDGKTLTLSVDVGDRSNFEHAVSRGRRMDQGFRDWKGPSTASRGPSELRAAPPSPFRLPPPPSPFRLPPCSALFSPSA